MHFYDEYKPFRNYMRRFQLLPSVVDVWRYSLHVMEGQRLPSDYGAGRTAFTFKSLKEDLYPWELEILARELVLNAGTRGDRNLKRWKDLAVAVNHIRRLDDAAYAQSGGDIIFELHRIAHRQFPWQIHIGVGPVMRAFKVFGEAAVEAIVVRELGMTTRQFLLLGAALGGHFSKQWGMSTNQDYQKRSASLGRPRPRSSDGLLVPSKTSRRKLPSASPTIATGSTHGTRWRQPHSSVSTRHFPTGWCARYRVI